MGKMRWSAWAASLAFAAMMSGGIGTSAHAQTAPAGASTQAAALDGPTEGAKKTNASDDGTTSLTAPEPTAEFRGVWVATVANIDWPSRPGLPVETQKTQLLEILDKAAELNLNAIVLQVRPQCDALYKSDIEPWSPFLTGEMGKAPEPFYDPLEFAVTESHKRGLELHAWFNPYRAISDTNSTRTISDNHITKTNPKIAKRYGKQFWLDPTDQATMDLTMAVILDVVKRYDIDGVHLDDYFYPYKAKGPDGKDLQFPDKENYDAYKAKGGKLSHDDFRRMRVDQFVERFYKETKKAKSHVKVGISPFGIWKPGFPKHIKGFSQYDGLYADAKLWLNKGWVDYWTPQLYWEIASPDQSFISLLEWWQSENTKERHVWPGQFTSRIRDRERNWTPKEIVNQIKWSRILTPVPGTVHFSMAVFIRNRDNINDALTTPTGGVYAEAAVVPAMPWLDKKAPAAPALSLAADKSAVSWTTKDKDIRFWVVQTFDGTNWSQKQLPASAASVSLNDDATSAAKAVAVRARDLAGNLSKASVLAVE